MGKLENIDSSNQHSYVKSIDIMLHQWKKIFQKILKIKVISFLKRI